MTNEGILEYLTRVKRIDRDIFRLEQLITAKSLMAVDDKKTIRELRMLKIRKAETILEIGEVLDRLSDEREALILTAYYIAGMTMDRISKGMGYSLQHIYRLRNSGRDHLREVLIADQEPRQER